MQPQASLFIRAIVVCALVGLVIVAGCALTAGNGAPAGPSASAAPGPAVSQTLTTRSPIMMDAVYVLATIAFFGVSVLYVYSFGRL